MIRHIHAAPAVLAAALFGAWTSTVPVVAASGTVRLDQVQGGFQGGLSVRYGATQTVTAGRGGKLVRVDIPLCTVIKRTTVQLTASAESGRLRQRATARMTFGRSSLDCLWYSFTFKNPITVRAGLVLRLSVSNLHGEAPLWAAGLSGRDAYRHGSGAWRGRAINDFAFRTYVMS